MMRTATYLAIGLLLLSYSTTAGAAKRNMDIIRLERSTKDGVALEVYGKILSEDNLTIRVKRFDGALLEYDKKIVKQMERDVEVEVPDWALQSIGQEQDSLLPGAERVTAVIDVADSSPNPGGGLDLSLRIKWAGPPETTEDTPVPVLLVVVFPKTIGDGAGFTLQKDAYAEYAGSLFQKSIAPLAQVLTGQMLNPELPEEQKYQPLLPLLDLILRPDTEIVLDVDTYLLSLPAILRDVVSKVTRDPSLGILLALAGGPQEAERRAGEWINASIPTGLTFDGAIALMAAQPDLKEILSALESDRLVQMKKFLKENIILIRLLPFQKGRPTEVSLRGLGRFLLGKGKGHAYVLYPKLSPDLVQGGFSDFKEAQETGDVKSFAEPSFLDALLNPLSPVSNTLELDF